MTPFRAASLLTHLSLAASGLCLAIVAMPLLPEMPFVLVGYLLLLGWSWRLEGEWILPAWAANVLALAIAGGAVGYVVLRIHSEFAFEWTREMPVQVALIPLLAPILMILLLVRLYRSRTPRDTLQLHGIALLQVALGCVLASGTVFGFFLVGYVVLALCSLAANEERRRRRESLPFDARVAATSSARIWPRLGLIWLFLILLVALPLFLLTPRVDGPDWEPLSRIGTYKARNVAAKTGFSEEIDLRRVGGLANDDAVAFTVRMTDLEGKTRARVPSDQHWRGPVLDRYENGVWRSELTSFSSATMFLTETSGENVGRGTCRLHFHFVGRTASLFLAEPIHPEATPGKLPIVILEPTRQKPSLFFEAGGTVLSSTYLPHLTYRYTQDIDPGVPRTRYPAVRVSDVYQIRLLRCSAPGMTELTSRLLASLVVEEPLRRALRDRLPSPGGRKSLEQQFEPFPPGSWARIAGYLEDHLARSGLYTYDMAASRTDRALDPTVDFLTNVRHGSCERYASGLTLMLRSIGIPARIVKGYRGGDNESGHYVVRQRHAHAWVEALVPSEGPGPLQMEWLTLDPTPSQEQQPGDSTIASWWEQSRRGGQSFWQEMIVGYGSRRQSALWEFLSAKGQMMVNATCSVFVVLIVLQFVRRFHLRRTGVRKAFALGSLFARLRLLLLTRWKLALRTEQTPAELAELARALLAGDPATRDFADLPARVVESYYRERYGLISADPGEVAALAAELDRLARSEKT